MSVRDFPVLDSHSYETEIPTGEYWWEKLHFTKKSNLLSNC